MELTSCLYECVVMHRRLAPKVHQFRYRIFMFCMDLDELDALAARLPIFSRNRLNLFAFYDADHLAPDGGSVREKLDHYLATQDATLPPGARVRLVTLPRVLGYVFNPVSFYFCFEASGAPRCAVVQVGNTFGEQKLFLIRAPQLDGGFRLETPKHFYVSPFSALDLRFDLKLRVPAESMEVHIDDWEGDARVLLTALTGTRAALTTSRLCWFGVKYPLVTLKVIAMIHWEAFRLWLRRLPWHRKADQPGLQRDVLRPHASLVQKGL